MKDSSRGAVIVVIIIVVTIGLYLMWNPKSDGGGTSGGGKSGAAPDFTATTIDGKQIKLSDYIGKKPVVVDFWATWCGPCMQELPVLQEFYSKNSDKVEILAVSTDAASVANNVSKVAGDLRLTFPVIHDTSGQIARLYPSRYIPYLVFIDVNGAKVHEATGYNPKIGEEILEKFGLD